MANQKTFVIDDITYVSDCSMGQGGSAHVWKVRRQLDNKVFAIKRIRKDSDANSARNERFKREIEYGREEQHPNVVRIHGFSEDEKYYHYVMDFFPKTLRDVIDHESDSDVLLMYTGELCNGVARVHDKGIVHRDIKPENILVDPDARRLVLADFGIAHFKESKLTERGDLLVNRNYLAPEQMVKNNAQEIDKSADIFSLGLIITEMFTKENARGKHHALVRDRYPFLADLDPILEQMTLQNRASRLDIGTICGLFRVVIPRINEAIVEIADRMRTNELDSVVSLDEAKRTLEHVARDVLSAKHVFERVSEEDLGRYNPNYHCEISYSLSEELFNACVQAEVYKLCKLKFSYEGAGTWDEHDDTRVASAQKANLLSDFIAVLDDFPLQQWSLWAGLPRQSAHLFRFCKDYHCEELLSSARALAYGDDERALRSNLIDAPIMWIIRNVRKYLNSDYREFNQIIREETRVEDHLTVLWNKTLPIDPERKATGVELFIEPSNSIDVANAVKRFESKWKVAIRELAGGKYSVMFNSSNEYRKFRHEILAAAGDDLLFRADVLNLLSPEVEHEDLVALTWDRDFDVAVTLGKFLGSRAL